MDVQILANSLIALKGTDLRMVHALLHKTNIGHLLSSKTKDIFSKEDSDHFSKHLEQEVEKLRNVEDTILQVDLFLQMTKLLQLRGTKYTLQKEIDDQCNIIVKDVYNQLLKQNKQFRLFAEKESESTKLQQMVKFQMSKLFNQLDDSFEGFSFEDQTQFAIQVNKYIQGLPEEKQLEIREKLGINDLTDEMVRKAIATSGTSIVFAIIVEISGFAFYTTATSLVATFAGVLGITLPFGVYTGLTSTIAVLANPLFIIPLLLGGGALLVNLQNKSLKKKLLPIIIMQIALPFMSKGEDSVSFDLFIEEWESRFQKYSTLHIELIKEKEEAQKLHNEISQTNQGIKGVTAEISNEIDRLRVEKERIYLDLKNGNLEGIVINDSFQKHRYEYRRITNEILSLNLQKESNDGASLFKKVSNNFLDITTSLHIKEEEKRADKYLQLMVEDILSSNSSYKKSQREKINVMNDNLKDFRKRIDKQNYLKNELTINLKQVNQNQSNITKDIKTLEKENYGLDNLKVPTEQL